MSCRPDYEIKGPFIRHGEGLFLVSAMRLTANARSAGSVQIKLDNYRLKSEALPSADLTEFKRPVALLLRRSCDEMVFFESTERWIIVEFAHRQE